MSRAYKSEPLRPKNVTGVNKVTPSSSHLHSSNTNWVSRGLQRLQDRPSHNLPFSSAGVSSSSSLHALLPGQILRDFPSLISNSEILFFSTHPSLCDDLFGLRHGERIEFGAGAWSGRQAVVVGTRGGQLWVVMEGDQTCRVLPLPVELLEKDPLISIIDALTEHYQLTKVAQSVSTPAFPHELTERVRQLEHQYSREQREFLQKAPDLFVQIDKTQQSSSQAQNVTPVHTHTRTSASRTPSTSPSEEAMPSYGEFASIPTSQRNFIILSPRVMNTTGALGWSGEDTVSVRMDAEKGLSKNASLSASVIL